MEILLQWSVKASHERIAGYPIHTQQGRRLNKQGKNVRRGVEDRDYIVISYWNGVPTFPLAAACIDCLGLTESPVIPI